MKTYKYETHLHTCQGSACGVTSGADYIEAFYKAGYAGLFVTDHFFGGNTAASAEDPWEKRVNVYCSGYEAAFKAAEEFNKEKGLTGTDDEFKVFFALEQTFDGDDYLIYGPDKKYLLNNPEIENLRHKELFNLIENMGGLMIQAHPFRLRDYIQAIHLHPRDVHGVEVYNGGNKPTENELALLYASQYNFPMTSGSDIHNVNFLLDEKKRVSEGGNAVGGMEFNTPLKDIFDYAKRIKNKEGKIIK
ncbi:MAG: PHP domain-containing protein [Treponema sp.]|nr:PHP domain-containing protein [Treponema sp.]